MKNIKIYRWVCKICKKEIKSFYPREFEYNQKSHMQIHKLPAKKKINKLREINENRLKTLEVENGTD